MCLPGIWMSSWILCKAWNSAVKELKGWPWKVCRQNRVSRPASRLSRYGRITTLFIHFDLSGMHARVLTKDLSAPHLLPLYPFCISISPCHVCHGRARAWALLMSHPNYVPLLVALYKTLMKGFFFFFSKGQHRSLELAPTSAEVFVMCVTECSLFQPRLNHTPTHPCALHMGGGEEVDGGCRPYGAVVLSVWHINASLALNWEEKGSCVFVVLVPKLEQKAIETGSKTQCKWK